MARHRREAGRDGLILLIHVRDYLEGQLMVRYLTEIEADNDAIGIVFYAMRELVKEYAVQGKLRLSDL